MSPTVGSAACRAQVTVSRASAVSGCIAIIESMVYSRYLGAGQVVLITGGGRRHEFRDRLRVVLGD